MSDKTIPAPNPNPTPAPGDGSPSPVPNPNPPAPVPNPQPVPAPAANDADTAKLLKELEDLRKEKQEREDRELSEKQKLEKDRDRMKAELEKLETENRRLQITGVAKELGFHNPSDALGLIDWKSVEKTDAATKAALEGLLKTSSYLAGPPGPDPTTTSNPARTTRLTRDDLKKLSPSEINKRWSEVQAVLKGQ